LKGKYNSHTVYFFTCSFISSERSDHDYTGETKLRITAINNYMPPSAQKRLYKTQALVDVNHLHLLDDLPEKKD